MDPDESLLARLQSGDVGVLAPLFARFAAPIHRLARGLLGNDADAEDAVQEVLVRVFERASQFDGRARLSTWIYRIAVNHCRSRLAHARVRAAETLPAEDSGLLVSLEPDAAERACSGEAREAALRLLERLPPEQRAPLLLRELEGLSYKEIADVLDVPVGTVMSRLSRARDRLARLVLPRPSLELRP